MSTYKVRRGTQPSPCPRGCGTLVYWTEQPRARAPGVVRLPVDCDGPNASAPDSLSDGYGVNHFAVCTASEDR